jgi:hypothetical protein
VLKNNSRARTQYDLSRVIDSKNLISEVLNISGNLIIKALSCKLQKKISNYYELFKYIFIPKALPGQYNHLMYPL